MPRDQTNLTTMEYQLITKKIHPYRMFDIIIEPVLILIITHETVYMSRNLTYSIKVISAITTQMNLS